MKRGLAIMMAAAAVVFAMPGSAQAAKHPSAVAVREATHLLNKAPVVPGSKRVAKPPHKWLKETPDRPSLSPLAVRKHFWTVDESCDVAFRYVSNHPPAGMNEEESTDGKCTQYSQPHELFIGFEPKHVAARYDDAELQIAVTPDGRGKAAIVAYGVAGTYPKRHASEVIPAPPTSVTITERRMNSHHVIARKSLRGKAAAGLVSAFDHMQVEPDESTSCPQPTQDAPVYQAVIVSSGHRWVTGSAVCFSVDVHRDGHRQPSLQDSGAWDHALSWPFGH